MVGGDGSALRRSRRCAGAGSGRRGTAAARRPRICGGRRRRL